MDFSDNHMMGDGDNGGWGRLFDPAVTNSSLVNNILNMPDATIMAENCGYIILRRAIPQDFIEKAVDSMNTQQPLQKADRFITYHPTSSARELVDELMRTHIDKLKAFIAPNTPLPKRSVSLGVFREKVPNPKPSFSESGVFITVALTPLNNGTGWYTLLKGSHLQAPGAPESSWVRSDENLDPGDAIIWRGDVAHLETAGGGGKFINIAYRTQQGD